MAITNNEIKFLKGAYSSTVSASSQSNPNAIMFTTGTPRMYVGGDVWYGNLTLSLDSDSKKIKLMNGTVEVSSVDTTTFVKDGMIQSVELPTEGTNKGKLVITWNTDAGKGADNVTAIDLSTIIPTDHLTGVTVDGVTAEVANNVATVNTPYVSGITINGGDVVTATNHVINLDIEDSGVTAVTVNGVDAEVADDDDKKLEVTIKGSDIELSSAYYAATYPDAFTAKSEDIAATDKIDEAVEKLDNNIAALADEMIKNEQVVAIATQALANAAGTVAEGGVIKYVKNEHANYINNAASLADADNKLDAAIKNLSDAVTELENKSIEIDNFEDSAVQIENNTNGIGAKLYWGTL